MARRIQGLSISAMSQATGSSVMRLASINQKGSTMGNRATIEVRDATGDKAPCYVYIHWCGSPEQVIEVVKKAAPDMRHNDCQYAMARLIGTYHDKLAGGLSLGVTKHKEEFDNGHYVVDMSKGKITNDNELIAKDIEFGQF